MNNMPYITIIFLIVITLTTSLAYQQQVKITKEVEQELANVTWQRDQCRHLYKQGI